MLQLQNHTGNLQNPSFHNNLTSTGSTGIKGKGTENREQCFSPEIKKLLKLMIKDPSNFSNFESLNCPSLKKNYEVVMQYDSIYSNFVHYIDPLWKTSLFIKKNSNYIQTIF